MKKKEQNSKIHIVESICKKCEFDWIMQMNMSVQHHALNG